MNRGSSNVLSAYKSSSDYLQAETDHKQPHSPIEYSQANPNNWVEVKFKKIMKSHWHHILSPTNLHIAKYAQTIVCMP